MLGHGASRRRIAHALNVAYADGLLSQETFAHRIDMLLRARVVEPARLIGDLSTRGDLQWKARMARMRRRLFGDPRELGTLLALDWLGGQRELVVGRHHSCDVKLSDPSVSRRHARLVFRDGNWVLQDLESTNGTAVNGVRVVRCVLRPGDRLSLGDEQLLID